METVERDGVALVREYRRAVEERDPERLSALVHADFVLEAPGKDATAELRERSSRDHGDGRHDQLEEASAGVEDHE